MQKNFFKLIAVNWSTTRELTHFFAELYNGIVDADTEVDFQV